MPDEPLQEAQRALREHMGSMAYAYAMGDRRGGGAEHPVHWATHRRTAELEARVRELRERATPEGG